MVLLVQTPHQAAKFGLKKNIMNDAKKGVVTKVENQNNVYHVLQCW